jgi:hypothetical protein
VELSPASVGAPIKNFRNNGGWGTEGLAYIATHGLVPASLWPCNAIDRKYDTPAANAERGSYRVTEWDDMAPNRAHMFSQVLNGHPVAIGLNWWSHEVTALAIVWEDNGWSLIFANSWGTDYGVDGFGKLRGSKQVPDDACSPRVVTI